MSLHSAFCFLFRILINQFVQWLSCSILCDPMDCSMPRLPCPSLSHNCLNSCSLSQWCHPSISILCHPLLFLHSIFPTIKVFSNEYTLRLRCPKYCRFSFSISPSNEHSGWISFRIDWFDILAVQLTLNIKKYFHPN